MIYSDKTLKNCKVKNCSNKSYIRKYCNKHYLQIKRYGKIFSRTSHDRNDILDKGTHYELVIRNRSQKIIAYSKFSKESLSKVKEYTWCLSHFTYIVTRHNNKLLSMSRILMNAPKNKYVDHANHNTLDNRLENLRIVTAVENGWNKVKRLNTSSIYKGVSKVELKKRNKWESRIKFKGKDIIFGRFDKEIHAAMVYDIWAKDLFGKYAYTNFKSINSQEFK